MAAPKRRPSMLAHECVLLAVDPGSKRAGWALFTRGKLVDTGDVRSFRLADICDVVDRLVELGQQHALPAVLVGEDWTAGGWPSLERYGRLCASWGPWEAVADDRDVRHLRVYLQTWRAAMVGGRQRDSKAWKRAARELVSVMFRVDVSDDVADAILLGKFAAHCAEVRDVLSEAA